jgi:hypothetical protein
MHPQLHYAYSSPIAAKCCAATQAPSFVHVARQQNKSHIPIPIRSPIFPLATPDIAKALTL